MIDQERRKISKLPSFVEYFCYMFDFSSAICGPIVDYVDYNNFMNQKDVYWNTQMNFVSGFRRIILSCFLFAVYLFAVPFLNTSTILTEEFLKGSFLSKLEYIFLIGTVLRLQYMSIFMLSQANIDLVGLSFNGYDENSNPQFGRIKMINNSFFFEKGLLETIIVRKL